MPGPIQRTSYGAVEARVSSKATARMSVVTSNAESFLKPTGETAAELPPRTEDGTVGPRMEMVVFLGFVLIKAFQPMVLAESKTELPGGKMGYPYDKSSAVVASTFLLCVFTLFLCFASGGKREFASIWEPKPMMVFSINGFVYALGDILELYGLEGLSAETYQIILQSRIIVTALLLMCAKGVYQTRLQWTLLSILMFGMSSYVVATSKPKDGKADDDVWIMITGLCFAVGKVVISSLAAVVSDKYMKVYKDDPTHVQIARMYVARTATTFMFMAVSGGSIWTNGFFHGWNWMTVAVVLAFVAKSAASLYIVALLDSLLKNVAESFSVLVTYATPFVLIFATSSFGEVSKKFEIAPFLGVMVVVSACCAYVDSKTPIDKAAKFDAQQKV